jgi:hypothetical protein
MCPALSPATPSQPPAHACSTPCTTDTATTLDSLDGPPASVASVLLGFPVESPQLPPRSHISCCSPQASDVSGAPDLGGDDDVPLRPLPVTPPPPRPFARATASSLADSDDDVPSPLILHRTALLLCYGDAAIPLPRPGVSRLSSSTSPHIVRPQPALQAGSRSRCPLGYG